MAKFYTYPVPATLTGGEKLVLEQSGEAKSVSLQTIVSDLRLISNIGDLRLEDLPDVTVYNPQDGDILIYNSGSGEWVNGTIDTGASVLSDLTDTNISSPSENEVLTYSDGSFGGEWISAPVPYPRQMVTDLGTLGTTCNFLNFGDTTEWYFKAAFGSETSCTFQILAPPSIGTAFSVTLELVTGATPPSSLIFVDVTTPPTLEANKTYRLIWTPKYTSTGYWLQCAEVN